jgi:hypothetical protein
MFRERRGARPEPIKPEPRTHDRDPAVSLGMMLAVIAATGEFIAMINAMTLGQPGEVDAFGAGFIAFVALGLVFELIRRVRHLERRLNARDRLERVTVRGEPDAGT